MVCCISLRNHSGAAKLPHAPSPSPACKSLHFVSLTWVCVRKLEARAVADGSTNTTAPFAHSPRACRPEPKKEGEGGMIIWGIFWGAVLGSWFGGYGDFGPFVGGILGFFAGLSLRWAIRSAIRTELQAHATKATAQPTRAPQAAPVAEDRPAAAPPAQPHPTELAVLAAKSWLLGGNTIVRVGLVILFIGLSFLARYAASAGLLPVEFRLAAVAAVGIALLGVGFRKRTDKPGFALALQGGGVAVMYLTVFAAFRLYGLLPPLWAFGLMIAVCAASCALALLQDSRALAVAAFAGGFAAPILLSTGQGSHVGLFSYYTLLNLAILFIAHQRSWRVLNVA